MSCDVSYALSWALCASLTLTTLGTQLLAAEQDAAPPSYRFGAPLLRVASNAPSLPPKPCEPGHILADHPIGAWHFADGSWYHATKNVYLYTTCVENRGNNTVYIDWIIPGPRRVYISKGDSASNPRYFPDHNTVGVSSCLIYGSYRDSIKEQFLGHQEDIQRAIDEGNDCIKASQIGIASASPQTTTDKGGGPAGANTSEKRSEGSPQTNTDKGEKSAGPSTRQKRSEVTPLSEPPWGLTAQGRTSFPSDSQDVDGTLIRFNYYVSLQSGSDGRYNIDLKYEAGAAFPDSFHGNIGDVRLTASSEILRQAIMQTGRDNGIIRLDGYSNEFRVSPILPKTFTITTDSYNLVDRNGLPVAAISVPVLSPTP